jgi:hypothetical protein
MASVDPRVAPRQNKIPTPTIAGDIGTPSLMISLMSNDAYPIA